MAMLDKIFFWRHKEPDFPREELGLGKESLGLPEEPVEPGLVPKGMPLQEDLPETPTPSIGAPPGMPSPGAPQMPAMQPVGKDIEVISAKLDALKAVLDSINQRLSNLERIARGGDEVY